MLNRLQRVKKRRLILLFILCPIFLYAQASEIVMPTDTLPAKTKHKITAMDVAGVAIPSLMITYGILSLESPAIQQLDYSTRNELLEDRSMLNSSLDDYFQFSPAVAAFALKACGVPSKHGWADMVFLYALSNVLETAVVYATKQTTPRERPDGSATNSFPSGHTATAFVAAQFLHEEYKGKSPWISVGGYTMATLIGAARVYNNRHWVSDVVSGAGIGILSTKVVYWTYPLMQKAFGKKDKALQTFAFPTYSEGVLGVGLVHRF